MARRAEDHKLVFPVGKSADSGLGRMGRKNNQQSPRPLCRPRAAGWVSEMLRRTRGHLGGQRWRPTAETAQSPTLPRVRVESPKKPCCSREAQARPREGACLQNLASLPLGTFGGCVSPWGPRPESGALEARRAALAARCPGLSHEHGQTRG